MAHRRLVITAALLSVIVTACAGPAGQAGVGPMVPAADPSSAETLSGTWTGHFVHPGTDSTSPPGSTNLTLQVRDDSTYTFQWGNRPQKTGTLAARGNRVILQPSSGSPIALVRSGNALYAVTKDDGSHGRTVVLSLEKAEAGATASAAPAARPTLLGRLCQAAGGVYAQGVCHPIAAPDLRAICEARGGTYFAGTEVCEVPAGGLRPS